MFRPFEKFSMNKEDSINWAKEYKADVKRLKISMVVDN